MHLSTSEVTHQVVQAADLERLVTQLAGRDYVAVPTPDSPIHIDGNLRDAAAARRWLATGGPAPHPRVLLNAFAHQGLICSGEYLVHR
ncbi:hypothetical protein [Streptomyces californicus]|uniref:hypothetical protein n=1 Tax=Streptomyces californicus TaxID=67351 RepID=UPI002970028D|nr:hypothetical protein [Streptomyces californicus]MDW4912570.1 hypothetical protein [Streptomyces californicus]